MTSLMGRWDGWHQDVTLSQPRAYGLKETYMIAAAFLADMDGVEDWGCGGGGFKPYCLCPSYRGIDGSHSPFADEIVDLTAYTSSFDGILMRHVIEHNAEWEQILDNAIRSFRKKLCVVLFTPLRDDGSIVTVGQSFLEGEVIPDLSFPRRDLEAFFTPFEFRVVQVGTENVYMIWRP